MASLEERIPASGFVVSLVSGVLILVNALALSMWFWCPLSWTPYEGAGFTYVWLVKFVTPGWLFQLTFLALLTAVAVGYLCAAMVILGSHTLRRGGLRGGLVVIVFSTLSLLIGGGFFLGFLLGIVGGSLGLADR